MLLSVMPGVVPPKTRVVWRVRGSQLRRGDRWSTRLLVRVCVVGAARADVIVYNSQVARREHEAIRYARSRARVVANGFAIGMHGSR